ncbi:Alpha/Beta hydrolase protein [Mycena alexandri]|uniref:Alpha/Beta hydrolase protein n=1 Tax=Mycena alexandri TaxID=1745969 RepID=A0AAD6TI67_9AGAR|nr:Alpha/Beta hydrolase protein [Mycena alexandri]
MSSQKPTIVLSHGLAHAPACYEPLATALRAAGFEFIAPRHPSLGAGVINATMDREVAALRSAMQPAIDAGKEIILLAHSYGGLVAAPAAQGYTLSERRAVEGSKSGGIKAVVYMTAFAASQKGAYPLDAVFKCGKELPAGMVRLEVDGKLTDNVVVTGTPEEKAAFQFVFYNDLEAAQVDTIVPLLESMALGAALEPTTVVPADLKCTQAYILCEKDNAMPPAVAEGYVSATPGMKVFRLDSGHAPFVSRVGEVVKILEDLARE